MLKNKNKCSFTLIGNDIYIVACNGTILRASKRNLKVRERWSVPPELGGMIQLTKIDDYFYLTVSTDLYGNAEYATILRVSDLSMLSDFSYEDLSAEFPGEGTPYYISHFDDSYYLTQHCMHPGTGVLRFDVTDNVLTDIEILHP